MASQKAVDGAAKIDRLVDERETFADRRTAELLSLFPEANAEGKIDWDALRSVLGEDVSDAPDRYSFRWAGKQEAISLLQLPSRGALQPCPEESVNFSGTSHAFIEGDNLEVLKLLYRSYFGRVKLIYIDPPYNTGNDFVYQDDFADPLDAYLRLTGQKDENGQVLTTNPEVSGRYHSSWLTMIYPRLFVGRQLLAEDGVIFISIDDHEVHNLRLVMNEIFGEENFIAQICHKARASVSNDKIISSSHNHILLYAKQIKEIEKDRRQFGLDQDLSGFDKEDDDRGKYKLVPVDGPGDDEKGNPFYEFLGVEDFFRFSKETMQEKYDRGEIVKVGNSLQQKLYLADAEKVRKTDVTWWDDKYYIATATKRLKELLGGNYFKNPKPVELIERMLQLWARSDDDIVLDFFAGSCPTAHAVMRQNRRDGIKRRWISVQLPEPTGKEDLPTIAEVGKERIRRAAAALDEQTGSEAGPDEDTGFKVFKLAPSSVRPWAGVEENDPTEYGDTMEAFTDPLVDGWVAENVLYEVAQHEGYGLNLAYEAIEGLPNEVWRVTDPDRGASFLFSVDQELEEATLDALELSESDLFICRDVALTDDTAANLALQCRLKVL